MRKEQRRGTRREGPWKENAKTSQSTEDRIRRGRSIAPTTYRFEYSNPKYSAKNAWLSAQVARKVKAIATLLLPKVIE
jgi:hypothetical protein